jgi:hypothetical protein
MCRPAKLALLALAGLLFLSACGTPLDPKYETFYACSKADYYCVWRKG